MGSSIYSGPDQVRIKEGAYLGAAFLMLMSWLMWDHLQPWQSFYNELLAGFSVLCLGLAVFITDLRQRIELSFPHLLLFAVVFVPFVQYSLGQVVFLGDAFMFTLYLGALLLAYWTGYRLGGVQAKSLVDVVAAVVLIAALVSLFLAFCQWLNVHNGWWLMGYAAGGRPYANVAQPNHLSTLLSLGVAGALYFRETGRTSAWVTALVVVALLAGIVLTRSRMPYMFLLLTFVWVLWKKPRLNLRCSTAQVVGAALVFMALAWLRSYLADFVVVVEEGVLVESGRVYGSGRFLIWQQILHAIGQAPLFGYGWGQVSNAQIAAAAVIPSYRLVDYSHNILLDLLVWNGVILGGLLIAALGWWAWSRLYQCRDIASWFLLLMLGIIGVHSLLEYPLAYTYFLLPAGLFAGIIDSKYLQGARRPKWRVPGFIPVLLVLSGWVFVGVLMADYRTMAADNRQMRLESRGLYDNTSKQEYKARFLTQLQEFNRFARTLASENMSELDLAWMGQVTHRYPYPPALFRHALALGLNGQYEAAELELLRLKNLHIPLRYEEGVEGWEILSERYPQLRQVRLP